MSKFSYENQGTNTYLTYELSAEDELDTMSLGMLTNNRIPGFAPASFMQMDTTKFIKYNVSAKVPVKQMFEGPVNKKRLLGVITGVVDAMLSAEEYMLDTQSILLDTDYIFADVSTCETELVCLPIANLKCDNPTLPVFFKNILFTTQFDQTENCDHVAQMINYLNGNPGLVLEEFKELLRSLAGMAAPVRQPVPQPMQQPVQQPAQPVVRQPVQQPAQPVVRQPVQQPAQPAARQPIQQAQQPVQQVPQKPVQQPMSRPAPQPPVQNAMPKMPQTPQTPMRPMGAPAQNPGMAIPNGAAKPQTPANNAANEKPMSWMYLMQHYNKENAAIYKQQQDAKKNKTAAPATQPMPGANVPNMPNNGFAVPGQPVPKPGAPMPNARPVPNSGFAVPGQNAPATAAPPMQEKKAAPAPQFIPAQPAMNPASAPVAAAPQPAYQPQPPKGAPLNFGETTVLSAGIGETTVLGGAMNKNTADPHLIRTKTTEKIPLNKPVFRIGKERSYVDYFVSDNTAISRGHANIVNHNNEFFVVDTNSTNHTYLNGAMIQSGQEMKLCHGDKIRLANEDFEFKMY